MSIFSRLKKIFQTDDSVMPGDTWVYESPPHVKETYLVISVKNGEVFYKCLDDGTMRTDGIAYFKIGATLISRYKESDGVVI